MRAKAAFGYDKAARQIFLGLKTHLRVCWPGEIVDTCLASAKIHELTVAEELFETVQGWAHGYRSYKRTPLAEKFLSQGLVWLTPYKSAKQEKKPWPRWLKYKRYRIETVIGQLVERFNAKKVWVISRWIRKVLSHSMAVFLCQKVGLSYLQFTELLID